jgi:hypothetical protein
MVDEEIMSGLEGEEGGSKGLFGGRVGLIRDGDILGADLCGETTVRCVAEGAQVDCVAFEEKDEMAGCRAWRMEGTESCDEGDEAVLGKEIDVFARCEVEEEVRFTNESRGRKWREEASGRVVGCFAMAVPHEDAANGSWGVESGGVDGASQGGEESGNLGG